MSAAVAPPGNAAPVASAAHLRTFVAVLLGLALAGGAAHGRGVAWGDRPRTVDLVSLYLSTAALNCSLVWVVWRGTRRAGTPLSALVGGRWSRRWDSLRDAAVAAAFWAVLLACSRLLDVLAGPSSVNDALLPRGAAEAAAWIVASVAAGVCEEIAFRGYLQRQLAARFGLAAAVVGQALAFGLVHAYQGMRAVARIAAVGLLLGVLAAWRRSLRPGILCHVWQDLWEGWLSRVA